LSGNVLQVGIVNLQRNPNEETKLQKYKLVSTAADKTVRLIPLNHHEDEVLEFTAEAPVLSYATIHGGKRVLFLTISGSLGVYDVEKREVASKPARYHAKFGVRIATEEVSNQGTLVATAGWDRKIQVTYLANIPSGSELELPEPATTLMLDSLPEDLLFKRHPTTQQLYLILSRRDSTYLYYYSVEWDGTSIGVGSIELKLQGKQNLAPYATSWNTFSAACLATCPSDPNLLAVATSSVPHMKVLLVRLLYPITEPENYSVENEEAVSARDSLAILVHANALVSQTAYSVPFIAWRPDSSGFWVNSDDGIVKGMDLNGKIVQTLKDGGHEPGSRIRCLFAGYVDEEDGDGQGKKEVLLSGGFDQQVIKWELGA
jgi:WD40 repeat protein